jgi:hypothetical protein
MAATSAYIGILVVAWILSISVVILSIVAYWEIYKKASEPGWAAIVPFYNAYVLYKITWGNGWYFLMAFVPALAASIIEAATYNSYFYSFDSVGSGVAYFVLLIGCIVISVITSVKLAHAFGKGGGWACGLIFLAPIFLCITAFSKDIMYVGVPGNMPTNEAGNAQSNTVSPLSQKTASNQMRGSKHVKVKYCPKCGLIMVNNKNTCKSSQKKQ